MGSDQAVGITSAQIKKLDANDIAALTSETVAALSPATLAAVEPSTFSQLSAEAFGLLTSKQIAALTPAQCNQFTNGQIIKFSADQAAGLTTAQFAKIQPNILAAIPSDAFAALMPSIFQSLDFTNFTATQVAYLSAEQGEAITSKQINALDASDFAGLSADTLATIKPESLKGLKGGLVGSSNTETAAINGLSVDALSAITTVQLAALSTAQLESLQANKIQYLSDNALAWFSSKGYTTITNSGQTSGIRTGTTANSSDNASVITAGKKAVNINGSSHADTIVGSPSNDTIAGGGGNDSIDAGAGNDTIVFSVANDSIDGSDGKDTLKIVGDATLGSDDNLINVETINITASANVSLARQSEDLIITATDSSAHTIVAGLGNDTITGGSGADTFTFNTTASVIDSSLDVITNYVSGSDKIIFGSTLTATPDNNVTAAVGTPNISNGIASFALKDNTLSAKLASLQNYEITNSSTVNTAVAFVDGANSYIFYNGSNCSSTSDDQLVKLLGVKAGSLTITSNAVVDVTTDTTPPAAPTFTLALDSNNSDNITKNGKINVSGLEAGSHWQYSLNGGTTWRTGSGSSFIMPIGTYATNSIWVKQADGNGNWSTPTKNTTAGITVDSNETPAPIVYLTTDVTQLDSVTALLKYNGTVQNNVNYQNYESIQWRARSSSPDLATDLTLGSTASTQVNLQGALNENTKSQVWYKINLTADSSLKILDSSADYDVVKVAVFDSAITGKSFTNSLYEPHSQLSSYSTLPAGTYFVRIDKGEAQASDSRLSQAINFDVKITTNTNDDFIVPELIFNSTNSTMDATIPTTRKVFYKFNLDAQTSFTIDTANFATNYDINIIQPSGNSYTGQSYSSYGNTPNQHIYTLPTGSYYLMVAAKDGHPVTQSTVLNIPILGTPTFNTTFSDNATSTLKADLTTAKPALTNNNDGDLVMTYTFDVSPSISNGETVTELTANQKTMNRLALQAISDVTKIKFVEVTHLTASKTNLVFGNVPDLGSSAAQAVTTNSQSGSEIGKATIEFSLAAATNLNGTNVGQYGYTTALHEISHALGIKHPRSYGAGGASSTEPFLLETKDSNQYSLMSYNKHPYTDNSIQFYSNSAAVSPKTLLLYDVGALQNLYGANTTYHNGNDTYSWDTDTDPFMTIWDGNGTDTIDVSNQSKVQTIDLRSGYFSSLGAVKIAYNNGTTATFAPKDNVSIAYDTVIENAIGSNQADTITGNSVSNVLTGNLGNDNFVFASMLSSNNIDTITDFSSGDKITLSRSIFTALSSGNVLTTNEYLSGSNKTVAETSLQHIIFDTLTKNLYYDADGVGGDSPIQFAILTGVSQLDSSVFFLQA